MLKVTTCAMNIFEFHYLRVPCDMKKNAFCQFLRAQKNGQLFPGFAPLNPSQKSHKIKQPRDLDGTTGRTNSSRYFFVHRSTAASDFGRVRIPVRHHRLQRRLAGRHLERGRRHGRGQSRRQHADQPVGRHSGRRRLQLLLRPAQVGVEHPDRPQRQFRRNGSPLTNRVVRLDFHPRNRRWSAALDATRSDRGARCWLERRASSST